MDSVKKSVKKALSWHLLHMLSVATIGFIVTGSLKLAAILASSEFVWESFMFFAHERAWAKFGKKVK